jgi:hypothetical protein
MPEHWFALVTLALGSLIGLLSSVGLARLNARRIAGNDLRSAFAPELATVRIAPQSFPTPLKDILDNGWKPLRTILEEAFVRHAIAVERYRSLVHAKDHTNYEAAWRTYYMEGSERGFSHYECGTLGQQDFIRNVEAILAFTRTPAARFWLGLLLRMTRGRRGVPS